MTAERSHFWQQDDDVTIGWPIERVLESGRTPYQSYVFWESSQHGVCAAIDGDVQSTEVDCATYHEALVHPAMLIHPRPRRVLILGGGEGATAREVLRYDDVEAVVMVDIDRHFVELCRQKMPHFSRGAFDDPRLEVRFENALEPESRRGGPFDVIIGDLTDEVEEGEQGSFNSVKFFSSLRQQLSPDGILVTQASSFGLVDHHNHLRIRRHLSASFAAVRSYRAMIDSFYEAWSWLLCSPVELPDVARLDELFARRLDHHRLELEHFDALSLAACFHLNKRLWRLLSAHP